MFNVYEKQGLRDFAMKVAVPLLELQGSPGDADRTFLDMGTGTLVERDGRIFLATASHVIDGTKMEKLVVPDGHHENANIIGLGKMTVWQFDNPSIDVGIVEIKIPRIADRLRKGWRVLTSSMSIDCPRDSSFLFFGYASALRKRKPGTEVEHPPLALLTQRLQKIPPEALDNADENPVFDNVDLFFRHSENVLGPTGALQTLPHLRGMSGSAVWAYQPGKEGSIWTPESQLRVVGIQSAVMNGSYIRAKSWHWVEIAIDEVLAGRAKKRQ